MSKPTVAIAGTRFVDAHGRHLILRGVNLGGDSKLPYPDGGTDRPSDFSDHREVSFVGRPFPLDQADEHLSRIARWGFNVLRLLVTWEAVEHAGPERYDAAYIDYVGQVCEQAAAHGLLVFIDFHQDAWSRMSGGSGAPGWIFEALGLDFRTFGRADAAHVMQYRYDYASPERRQEQRYPTMSWPLNYRMPVNGILWTAFFAGGTFTPDWTVDRRNVQDFLQGHYFGAVQVLARRLRELPNVIGFDTLNEPGLGWIGQKMSVRRTGPTREDRSPVLPGPAWTPFDGLRVARGLTVRVPYLNPGATPGVMELARESIMNAARVPIWKTDGADPFERAGAWRCDGDGGVVLDEDFFCLRAGRRVDAEDDFLKPFFYRMAATIRAVREDWLLFAEINPHVVVAGRRFPEPMPERTVNASHWYDVALLWSKRFEAQPDEARRAALANRYGLELGYLRSLGERLNAPTLIGEFGVPYDLNDGESFARWRDGARGADAWRAQSTALELTYDTLDALLLSSAQWNYTASNRNDLRVGDGWNQEDLSIYSRDQQTDPSDPDSGGRAVEGFCRPYVRRAQGVLKQVRYDARKKLFSATLEADAAIAEPTEIFVPHFLEAPQLSLAGVDAHWTRTPDGRCLLVRAAASGSLRIEIRPKA